jgi:hypothetical protein
LIPNQCFVFQAGSLDLTQLLHWDPGNLSSFKNSLQIPPWWSRKSFALLDLCNQRGYYFQFWSFDLSYCLKDSLLKPLSSRYSDTRPRLQLFRASRSVALWIFSEFNTPLNFGPKKGEISSTFEVKKLLLRLISKVTFLLSSQKKHFQQSLQFRHTPFRNCNTWQVFSLSNLFPELSSWNRNLLLVSNSQVL